MAPKDVGVLMWHEKDGISEAICDELSSLGYQPIPFIYNGKIPPSAAYIFSFGPYGDFLNVPRRLASRPRDERPIFIHWNTEGLPDLRIPGRAVRLLGQLRTQINQWFSPGWMVDRMLRFRYVGDYYYAFKSGWLNVFADSSVIYSDWHREQGLPTVPAPWGATPRWYNDLKLERDIDVLWMGNRGSRRRDHILNRLEKELADRNVSFYLADNITNPFVFDDERTDILNRTKITLNLTRTWYDDNYSRFSLAAANRSLIVSEPILPHCADYKPGVHFVSAQIENLADTIVDYLNNDEKRQKITEDAYQLVTTKLTFRNSIFAIMSEAEQVACEGINTQETRYEQNGQKYIRILE